MKDFLDATDAERIFELAGLTTLEAVPDSRSSTDVQDPKISGSASSESFRAGDCEGAAEATTSSEEARASSVSERMNTAH